MSRGPPVWAWSGRWAERQRDAQEAARVPPGMDLVDRLAKALGTSTSDLLPETATPYPLPVFKELAQKLTETLKEADRETLLMVIPLLAGLLESPTRRR